MLSEDISDEDGVAGGHLFGVGLPARVRDLSMGESLLRCPYGQEMNKALANKKWQQPTIHQSKAADNSLGSTAAGNSLDSAADDDLLESETNNKGKPFFVKNLIIRPYLGGCRTISPTRNDAPVTCMFRAWNVHEQHMEMHVWCIGFAWNVQGPCMEYT